MGLQQGRVTIIQSTDTIKPMQELAKVHGINAEFALFTIFHKGLLDQQRSFSTSRHNRRQIDKLWVTRRTRSFPNSHRKPVGKTNTAPSEVALPTFRITIPQQFLTQRDWEHTAIIPGRQRQPFATNNTYRAPTFGSKAKSDTTHWARLQWVQAVFGDWWMKEEVWVLWV